MRGMCDCGVEGGGPSLGRHGFERRFAVALRAGGGEALGCRIEHRRIDRIGAEERARLAPTAEQMPRGEGDAIGGGVVERCDRRARKRRGAVEQGFVHRLALLRRELVDQVYATGFDGERPHVSPTRPALQHDEREAIERRDAGHRLGVGRGGLLESPLEAVGTLELQRRRRVVHLPLDVGDPRLPRLGDERHRRRELSAVVVHRDGAVARGGASAHLLVRTRRAVRRLHENVVVAAEVEQIFEQARNGRIELIDAMEAVIPAPREEMSKYAPRMITVMIDPEKIGKLIGPGGKMIRSIQERTGTVIEVEDDGTVFISSTDGEAAELAKAEVEALGAEIKVGTIYQGKVVSTKDFGAFVELAPGTDGMCHISELADGYVEKVDDVVKIGDVIKVKVLNVDDNGRIKLSRRAAIADEEGTDGGGDDGASGEGGGGGDDGASGEGGGGDDKGGRRRRGGKGDKQQQHAGSAG